MIFCTLCLNTWNATFTNLWKISWSFFFGNWSSKWVLSSVARSCLHAQAWIFSSRPQARELVGYKRCNKNCWFWSCSEDQFSTTIQRICLYTLVSSSRGSASIIHIWFCSRYVGNGYYHGWIVYSPSSLSRIEWSRWNLQNMQCYIWAVQLGIHGPRDLNLLMLSTTNSHSFLVFISLYWYHLQVRMQSTLLLHFVHGIPTRGQQPWRLFSILSSRVSFMSHHPFVLELLWLGHLQLVKQRELWSINLLGGVQRKLEMNNHDVYKNDKSLKSSPKQPRYQPYHAKKMTTSCHFEDVSGFSFRTYSI